MRLTGNSRLQILAANGMGEVYRARAKHLPGPRVLKK